MYIRSSFSLLESVIKIDELFKKAKDMGYLSLALVDHNLNGSMTFYKQSLKYNIKSIFGLEINLNYKDNIYPVILYARDDIGFVNLMKLSSIINIDQNKLNLEIFNKYKDHTIVALDSSSNIFYKFNDNTLKELKDIFNEYYIGISNVFYEDQKRLNQKIKKSAKELNIKTFAMNKTYYLNQDDYESYKVIRAIGEKKLIDDKDLTDEIGHHLFSIEEMAHYYDDEDLIMSDYIASLCHVELNKKRTKLPKYECPNNVSSKEYLKALALRGLSIRLHNNVSNEYLKRLNYELNIILSMHFEDYFLIVYDFILYAKRNNIYVGPGRGSACASLVSYCLGITEIDPLKYGLIFERFLNPERISMPDIDVDFPDNRRDEVIDYVKNKYGKNHIAHIVTYGTLSARQVLRDVARVLNYPKVDAMCKAIPNDLKITLNEAYQSSKYFRQRVDFDYDSRRLFELSLKLEGLPRHISTHAAGIVMSYNDLSEVVPLVRVEEDLYSCGYTMEHLEELGLIKMDFLGLRNLAIIAEIKDDINNYEDFNIRKIPLDDPKTFDLISNVNTLGIFQLESSGMQNLIRKLRPQTFEDIALTIALFRPGPMENIPAYLYNREHKNEIKYLHPILKDILKETDGIIVYQEQIMTIAKRMAGFSFSKADILRKAMSKKKYEELVKLEDDFIKGSLKNNIQYNVAKEVYALILKFANYGFNKAHSIAYARVAYEMAYLKANYPLFFYKALLNGSIGSSNKTYEYISECQKLNIKISGPSINLSNSTYYIEHNHLRMPLSIIKNVGSSSLKYIIEERNIHGEFKNFEDTVSRLKRNCSTTVIESLIDAGAFDEFNYNRTTLKANLADALKRDESFLGLDNPLFALKMNILKNDTKKQIINEKNVLGFNFSINPLLEYKKQYNYFTRSFNELIYDYSYVKGFGYVLSFKEYTNKNHEKMCFIKVGDDTAVIDLVVHSSLYLKYKEKLIDVKGKYLYFEGNMQKEASCVIKKLEVIN